MSKHISGAEGAQACDSPPPGWYCTRERGHDGPCAALPLHSSTRPEPKFIAWRCEKCGSYHAVLFPDSECDHCNGDSIAKRMGLIKSDL